MNLLGGMVRRIRAALSGAEGAGERPSHVPEGVLAYAVGDIHGRRDLLEKLVAEIDAKRPVVIIFSAFSLYSPEKVDEQIGSRVFRTLRKPSPPRDLLAAVADAVSSLDGSP